MINKSIRIRTARELRLENEKTRIEMDEKDLEIERLRATLEKIAVIHDGHHCATIARAALDGSET